MKPPTGEGKPAGESRRPEGRRGEDHVGRFRVSVQELSALRSLAEWIAPFAPHIAARLSAEAMDAGGDRPNLVAGSRGRALQGVIERYIVSLFSGELGPQYASMRSRIGQVHHERKVDPGLFLYSWHRLFVTLAEAMAEVHSGSNGTSRCMPAVLALHKLMALDLTLAMDAYIGSLTLDLEEARARQERHAAELELLVAERTHELELLSTRDSLTGLANHRVFYDTLERELALASRSGHPVSLLFLDLDRFKDLNDRRGHLEGDELLRVVGRTIRDSVRLPDTACRYGGDEFAIIMPATTASEATTVCERVIGNFSAPRCCGITFSAGIAQTGPKTFVSSQALVREADRLMYAAKATDGFHIVSSVLAS